MCIGFTPDEEIGRGADRFDVKDFGAAVAYTVDGGPIGEIEYENFNAASGKVRIQGASIHPGDAKLKMKNAILIGMEFQSLLPVFENPMYTEGYEGFYHLDEMSGNVEEAQLNYIIRDHDHEKFEQKKKFFAEAADFLSRKYGKGTVIAEVTDSYYNMREKRSFRSAAAPTAPASPTWGSRARISAPADITIMENMNLFRWRHWRRRPGF